MGKSAGELFNQNTNGDSDDMVDGKLCVTRFGDLVQGPFYSHVPGEKGLILSIIECARRDFLFGKDKKWLVDAADFFLGPDYKHYITLLGLPMNWLPDGITEERLKYIKHKWGRLLPA